MTKTIEHKGRQYKAEVNTLVDRNGRQFDHATIKIGRNEIGLIFDRNTGWVKNNK